MSGHPIKYDKNSEVWDEARKRLKESLDREETVVFDATFTNPEQRKKFLEFVRESGAEKIQGIFFDTPLEAAKERNLKREHRIEESEIERRDEELRKNMPGIKDGLDSIFTLDEYHNLAAAEMSSGEASIKKEFRK